MVAVGGGGGERGKETIRTRINFGEDLIKVGGSGGCQRRGGGVD
jgi:hypothetical protein